MKKKKCLAKINIYLSPNLGKYLGLYETEDNKNFFIVIKTKQPLKEFIDTYYHELTHVLLSILERAVEVIGKNNYILNLNLNEKQEEKISQKIAYYSTKIFLKFLKKIKNENKSKYNKISK